MINSGKLKKLKMIMVDFPEIMIFEDTAKYLKYENLLFIKCLEKTNPCCEN